MANEKCKIGGAHVLHSAVLVFHWAKAARINRATVSSTV